MSGLAKRRNDVPWPSSSVHLVPALGRGGKRSPTLPTAEGSGTLVSDPMSAGRHLLVEYLADLLTVNSLSRFKANDSDCILITWYRRTPKIPPW